MLSAQSGSMLPEVLGRGASSWRLRLVLLSMSAQVIAGVSPSDATPGQERASRARGAVRRNGDGADDSLSKLLDLTPDPKSPHEANGFVPRQSDDPFAFGNAHALTHHVLENSVHGDPVSAEGALDAFAMTHMLNFGLGMLRKAVMDQMMASLLERSAVPRDVQAPSSTPGAGGPLIRGIDGSGKDVEPLHVLVLGSGMGEKTLRLLPSLLRSAPSSGSGGMHEIVSIETNPHMSGYGARLIAHALGAGDGPISVSSTRVVRHTPLLMGEGTSLSEAMDTLNDGYGIQGFHVVMLGDSDKDDRPENPQHELASLMSSGALKDGSVVHAVMPTHVTDHFLDFVKRAGSPDGNVNVDGKAVPKHNFDTKVKDVGKGQSAVMATLKHKDEL